MTLSKVDISNESTEIHKIANRVLTVAPSNIFTHTTRLADAWRANVMEINLPQKQLDSSEIEIVVRHASTKSLGIPFKSRNLFKKIYKKFAAPIQMDDEYIYDSRFDDGANIAHILAFIAPSLLMAKEMYPKITVILKGKASTLGRDIYKTLGFPIICTDKEVQGKLITATKNSWDNNYPYYGMIDRFYRELTFEGFNQHTPERVFISRRGTRSLINEKEVEQTLQEYGFKKFYFEDIPLSEQWSIARNAKVVVGLHGAALSSLVFNRNAAKVVELFHPGFVIAHYRILTNAIGGKWCGVTGQITDDVIRDLDFKHKSGRRFANTSTRIDIASLHMALESLEVGARANYCSTC